MIDFTNKTLYQVRREALLLIGKKILVNGKPVIIDSVMKSRKTYFSHTNFDFQYDTCGEVDIDKATRYKPFWGFQIEYHQELKNGNRVIQKEWIAVPFNKKSVKITVQTTDPNSILNYKDTQ